MGQEGVEAATTNYRFQKMKIPWRIFPTARAYLIKGDYYANMKNSVMSAACVRTMAGGEQLVKGMQFVVALTVLLIAAAALSPSVWAQTTSATISGLVTDSSGAVVVDAEVQLQSVERGSTQSAKTNNAGIYVFAGVQPGQYQVRVQKAGFKQVDFLGLIANVQDHIEQNFRLQVGSVMESVTVEASGLSVNTTDASVSTVIDQTYVKNMPLNGRSFQDLILLTPGIVTNSPQAGGTLGATGEFSVNGQRTESNYYTVDGVSANVGVSFGESMESGAGPSGSVPGATALGTTQALVSVDDLQEFRVQSSTYSAEYGRNPGGQFAFQTKSGTNEWHGALYDYLRNDIFDANDYFNDYLRPLNPTLTKPALRQNDFGGAVGGPVRIPGLYNGKDRTFFFVSYEGLRLVAPQAASTSSVPDFCMRGIRGPQDSAVCVNATTGPYEGCSSFLPDGSCAPGASYNRTPAVAALLPVVNAFPSPSPNGLEDSTNGIGQFIGTWSNPGHLDSTSIRFDHAFASRARLFFRFSDTTSNSIRRGGSGSASSYDSSAYDMKTYTTGLTSILSARVSNDFRLNYSSNENTIRTVVDSFGGSTPVNLAELSGLGGTRDSAVFATLAYSGYFAQLGPQEQFGEQKQWNLVDSVSLSRGGHQLRFGFDYRRLASVAVQPSDSVQYSFGGESSVETNTPDAFVEAIAPAFPLYRNFSLFAQDEWRASQRLNFSFGLRWDVNPAPGVTQGLKPYTIQGSSPNTWALAPQGTPLWHTTWYNFAPRLGVAYVLRDTPERELVVRGGGGLFFDTGQQLGSMSFNGPGFSAFSFLPGAAFPVSANSIPTIVNPPVAGTYGAGLGFAPHLQLPYTLQWNASIEQALGKDQALTVSYVGSHASRLLQTNAFAPTNNPNANFFGFVENGLTADYDALQAQFRRRLSRGLTVLASYTWSHCIDYGSLNNLQGYERGNCDFDVRQNFSAAFSYDAPKFEGNQILEAILRDWGLDDRFSARTAFPVTLAGSFLLEPNGKYYDGGLNLVQGQPIYLFGGNCAAILQDLGDLPAGQGCPGGRAINPQAFTLASSGLGDAPRNFARGFGAWQMDLAVRREFPIHERLKLQFRAEAFNIFNHPNFGMINGQFGGNTFGQATATLARSLGVLSSLYQSGGPRSMQFALKLVF